MALKYVLVNLKASAEGYDCACCKTALAKTYVRDFGTDLLYHNPWCYEAHVVASIKALEGRTYAAM